MKVIASVSVEVQIEENESIDEAQQRAIDELIDSLDDWINNDNSIPPIIKIDYLIPDISINTKKFIN